MERLGAVESRKAKEKHDSEHLRFGRLLELLHEDVDKEEAQRFHIRSDSRERQVKQPVEPHSWPIGAEAAERRHSRALGCLCWPKLADP